MSQFEQAVDALVAGDEARLRAMLQAAPELVRARSERAHMATLLHYCAANGVEQERQVTPANIVATMELLLAAGADVNATANLYSGAATTLMLTATSGHPERAGVQQALLQALLDHGAEVRPGDVAACLWNGRAAGADFLAGTGGQLSLAEAAGLGRLDRVRELLAAGAEPKAMENGFLLACQYGRNSVIKELAAHGANLDARTRDGQTGLHMAAIGAQEKTLRLLLRLGLNDDAVNTYGGTVLGQAQWSAEHSGDWQRYAGVIAVLETHMRESPGSLGAKT